MSRYLCPVCRSTMGNLPSSKLGLKAYVQILLITTVICAAVYFPLGPWAAARAALVFLPLWTAAEWVHWLKIREAFRCRTCDFDSMLYRRDWKAARRKVEIKMQGLSDELQARIKTEITRIQNARPNAVKNPSEKSPS
ncbi:MAG: hypothetical protein ABIR96_08455 [Bdellovibrionota bacterium]